MPLTLNGISGNRFPTGAGEVIPQWRVTSPDGTLTVAEYSLSALLDALGKLT